MGGEEPKEIRLRRLAGVKLHSEVRTEKKPKSETPLKIGQNNPFKGNPEIGMDAPFFGG